MSVSKETLLWTGVALVLAALAVPWFMWGTGRVVAGLPVWVWWHVGWLALTAVVFAVFARTAWGVGVEVRGGTDG
ncbi:MAG: hypothetical protein BRD23_02230 [Halobacteriales archaeon SW_9_67_25]|nr:MAG: hypothetical protein BRD23_02230 [Halobacteriales archaeon SW_9_67_25]